MTITRRQALAGAAALLIGTPMGVRLAAAASPAATALERSQLIYLSPVISGGRESACHAEVWFVAHQGDVFVCTQAGAWRAEAIRRGFTRAKIWVGEFGVWTRAGDRYRSAPYLELEGRLESDAAVQADVLGVFGHKYASEWERWGPRFEDGLATGKRVLLRYAIAS